MAGSWRLFESKQSASHPQTAISVRQKKVHIVIVVISLFICVETLLAGLYYVVRIPPQELFFFAALGLIVLYGLVLWSWYTLTQELFDPYILFFSAAFLFNAGVSILILQPSGNHNYGGAWEIFTSFRESDIFDGLFLVLVSLTAFHMGALSSLLTAKGMLQVENNRSFAYANALRVVGMSLIVVSAIPTALRLREFATIANRFGYQGLYLESASYSSGLFAILTSLFVTGILFLLAGSKGKKMSIALSMVLMGVYVGIYLSIGIRNKAVMPLIAYVWVWHKIIKPLPKAFLFSCGFVMLFFIFPLLRFTRNSTASEIQNVFQLWEIYRDIDNSVIATIGEMGKSIETIIYTMQFVPKNRGFELGGTYVNSLLVVIPNLFWDTQPASVNRLSFWLVEQVYPSNYLVVAGHGWTIGYSFIAEAYLNFGWLGSIVCLAVIGSLFVRFVLWGRQDIQKIATVAAFLPYFLFFSREESLNLTRSLLYYSVIPYFLVLLVHSGVGVKRRLSANRHRIVEVDDYDSDKRVRSPFK